MDACSAHELRYAAARLALECAPMSGASRVDMELHGRKARVGLASSWEREAGELPKARKVIYSVVSASAYYQRKSPPRRRPAAVSYGEAGRCPARLARGAPGGEPRWRPAAGGASAKPGAARRARRKLRLAVSDGQGAAKVSVVRAAACGQGPCL